VDICPTQALDQVNDKAFLRYPDRCTYCTKCEDVCLAGAIALPFLIVLVKKDDIVLAKKDNIVLIKKDNVV
jgi:Fe-S-cluster-containing hydrogenase component 2